MLKAVRDFNIPQLSESNQSTLDNILSEVFSTKAAETLYKETRLSPNLLDRFDRGDTSDHGEEDLGDNLRHCILQCMTEKLMDVDTGMLESVL